MLVALKGLSIFQFRLSKFYNFYKNFIIPFIICFSLTLMFSKAYNPLGEYVHCSLHSAVVMFEN